jgi:N6-adenosine-specific RNA methylase IME4
MNDLRDFGAILCDPPWAFKTYSGKHSTPHRCAEDHYTTMHLSDLKELPVEDMAAKNCALFMWTVDSHLPDGIDLAKAWGFDYKTVAFVWEKGRIGMGYWTRKQAEVCLMFTRGKPVRISKGVRQVIREPRREHSRKPDCTHTRIAALVGGPYLELFARSPVDGWTVWGNETDKFTNLFSVPVQN